MTAVSERAIAVRWDGTRAVVVPGGVVIRRTALDRFLDMIIALDPEQGEHWIWQGAQDSAGYPRFHITRVHGQGYAEKAYRWAYEQWVGPIPGGYEVHHVCETPLCVNPDHLQALTPRQHTLEAGHRNVAALNAAKTHCKRGHAFDEANTYWFNGGRSRACRTCKSAVERQRQARLTRRAAS